MNHIFTKKCLSRTRLFDEGDYFIDLKYSIHMVATNVSETPIWSAAGYTLTVKDGATSFWVTLPRNDPFETLARQKCESWFTNATLLSNCQLGNPFIETYKEQCYEDCLLYTSPSPRDLGQSRMPSSA